MRKTSIETYYKSGYKAAKSNNGILPYGDMTKFVDKHKN